VSGTFFYSQIKRLLAFVESAWEKSEAKAKAQAEQQPIEMPLFAFAEETSEAETLGVRGGDWVTYYDPRYPGERKRVRIVDGANDSARNLVGSHTPLATALLAARIGDEVELVVEGQPPRTLKILDID